MRNLSVEVRRRSKGEVVGKADFDIGELHDGRQELQLVLPPLEGEYEIALIPEGDNVPNTAVVQEFERRVFPWEHNQLGRSTEVFPPFEPITIEGSCLNTVLREHQLNDVGLWDQVTAASAETGVSRPILAEPMRYVGAVDGKRVTVITEPLQVVSAERHEVVTRSLFSVGPIACEAESTWDYDGQPRFNSPLVRQSSDPWMNSLWKSPLPMPRQH